jgi:hypothetical protein
LTPFFRELTGEGSLWLLCLAECATSHTTDFLMNALEEVFNKQLIEQFANYGLQI